MPLISTNQIEKINKNLNGYFVMYGNFNNRAKYYYLKGYINTNAYGKLISFGRLTYPIESEGKTLEQAITNLQRSFNKTLRDIRMGEVSLFSLSSLSSGLTLLGAALPSTDRQPLDVQHNIKQKSRCAPKMSK